MPSLPADSAGVPWKGRSFHEHPQSGPDDDGSAPPGLLVALQGFSVGKRTIVNVVDELRASRLLVPLVAQLAEDAPAHGGLGADKRADLAIISVAGPDGRRVLPVFTSVDTMLVWNADARPVPSDAVRVALAAASDGTELVVVDAGSPTEFVVRRPALWAIAQQQEWVPSFLDDGVVAAFAAAAAGEASVAEVRLAPGDPTSRLVGPELAVTLVVYGGLDRAELEELVTRISGRIAADAIIARRIDSMGIAVIPFDPVAEGR